MKKKRQPMKMKDSMKSRGCCYNINVFIVLLFSGFGNVSTITSQYHNITVDIQRPGRVFSPGSVEQGEYYHDLNITWNLRTSDPDQMALVVYPTFVDLEGCCDRLTVTAFEQHGGNLVSGQITIYTGSRYTPFNPDDIHGLMQLPIVTSTSGYASMLLKTDHSVAFSGIAMRYFAKDKNIILPNPYSTIPTHPELKQAAVQQQMGEFTIEAPTGERIWLQVVYLNLSIASMYTTHCQSFKVVDRFCSIDDCILMALCRHAYDAGYTTLVSYSNAVVIDAFNCGQPDHTDCAIINYKQYDETDDDQGCPRNDTADVYETIKYDYWLDHSFNVNSPPSDINKIWWIENVNANEEMLIYVKENELGKSPDCSIERIELYRSHCMTEKNLITYFCGDAKETFRLANSRFLAVRFTTSPEILEFQYRQFTLLIQPAYTPYTGPIPGWRGFEGSLDEFSTLVLIAVAIAAIAALTSVYFKYQAVQRQKSRQRVQSVHTPAIQRKVPTAPPASPAPPQTEMYPVPPASIYDPPQLSYSRPQPSPAPATQYSVAMRSFGQPSPNIGAPYPTQHTMPPPAYRTAFSTRVFRM